MTRSAFPPLQDQLLCQNTQRGHQTQTDSKSGWMHADEIFGRPPNITFTFTDEGMISGSFNGLRLNVFII